VGSLKRTCQRRRFAGGLSARLRRFLYARFEFGLGRCDGGQLVFATGDFGGDGKPFGQFAPVGGFCHGVALAHEGQQRIQFRPLGVLSRRFVGEYLVHPNLFELAFLVRVEAADPDIADTLTVQGCLLRKVSGRNL
jgi:hypothetical protein